MKSKISLYTSYLHLPSLFYDKNLPSQMNNPCLVLYNDALAKSLGLPELSKEEIEMFFSGNDPSSYEQACSMAYAGHQYGHFTMLGDGRAHLLGEILTSDGKRFDVQLKGSGRTVFSRGGDGKATLSAMLREYIMSEGFAGMGIPTTRSLALLTSDDVVYREHIHRAGLLTRIASSHIRVGTFEYAAYFGGEDAIKALALYTRDRHFPDVKNDYDMYLSIIKKQAKLIAKWQSIGFVHGVMNTDNMSICGETIDYGPCAFLDIYLPSKSFSSIDHYGRYRFEHQPVIAKWNLAKLGESMKVLFDDNPLVQSQKLVQALNQFDLILNEEWITIMSTKLGLQEASEDDQLLIHQLLRIMENEQLDYTNTFVFLTYHKSMMDKLWCEPWVANEPFQAWFQLWQQRIKKEPWIKVYERMVNSNPKVIPRNHIVEQIIQDFETSQSSELLLPLLDALSNPFSYNNSIYLTKFQAHAPSSMIDYVTYCGT